MRTLSTLDLSALGGGTFDDALRWHSDLLGEGVRLGQPVKCVRLPDGQWGATLRIGLAMWQIVDHVAFSDRALANLFEADMERISSTEESRGAALTDLEHAGNDARLRRISGSC